jgi:hypothetical protein
MQAIVSYSETLFLYTIFHKEGVSICQALSSRGFSSIPVVPRMVEFRGAEQTIGLAAEDDVVDIQA